MKIEEKQIQKFARKNIQVLICEHSFSVYGASMPLSNGVLSVEQQFHIRHLIALNSFTSDIKFFFLSQSTSGTYVASLS